MGLMQSVATTEGRLLAFGLFGSASKGIEPSTKKTQGQDIIIMPVDSSGHSEAAFEWYVKHMHKSNNVLRLIHCQDPSKKESDAADRRSRTAGKALVEKYQHKLQANQIAGSVHSEYGTNPGEMIIFSVDRYRGTHIVMGTRGLNMLQRSLLGSVSHYVLDHTRVPVTVIPKEVAD